MASAPGLLRGLMQLKNTSVGLEAAAGGKMGKAEIEEC